MQSILLAIALLTITHTQIGTPTNISNNVTLNIFDAGTVKVYPEPTSNNYPKDTIVNVEIANTYVYTL